MNSPIPHPEIQRLQERRVFLRERLAALATEEGDILQQERPNLLARYYQSVGHLEVEVLRLEIESSRTKREIEMIQAAQGRGTDWDYATIQAELDSEFAAWQEKLQKEQSRLAAALDRNNHLLSAEDSLALTKLYRELVKCLHPDLNPYLHPEKTPLWHRLQMGYACGDLEELRLVEVLLGADSKEEVPSSIEVLTAEIKGLESNLAALLLRIEAIQKEYPFTLKSLLDDPAQLDSLRTDLEEKVRIGTERRNAFKAHLQTILDTPLL